MRILILGAFGRLGTILCDFLEKSDCFVYKWGRKEYELHNKDFLNFIYKNKVTRIINLIALTDVRKCEINKDLAYKVNVHTLENIIEDIKISGIPLIHISTDHLYSKSGYSKECEINLLNEYALTKYSAEIVAHKANTTILRTNYVYRSPVKGKTSYLDWLINSIALKENISLFNNIKFSPLYGTTLCEKILLVLENPVKGTFNLGTKNSISKAQFAFKLSKEMNQEMSNAKVCSYEQECNIIRPLDMSLDVSKFEKEYGISLPMVDETIKSVCSDY